MNTISIIGALLDGFGWALLSCLCAACLAYFCRDSLVAMIEQTVSIDYDDLETEEVSIIEEARAELAQKARARALKAQKEAEAARLDALSTFAIYTPAHLGKWENVAAQRLAHSSISELTALSGIGKRRAKRIQAAGTSLDWEALRRICTAPVASQAILCV